jgi:hypothetical protein
MIDRAKLSMAYSWIFGCIANRHEPSRRTVVWDGLAFKGSCKHCRRPITRKARHKWRAIVGNEESHAASEP